MAFTASELSPAQRAVLAELGIDVWVNRQEPETSGPAAQLTSRVNPAPVHTGAPSAEPVGTWADLEARIHACIRCDLHAGRTQAVCGVGKRTADWLIIGEAPGAEEDLQGEPFVGPAGKLLNAMLMAAGQPREQVFIANVLKCRPPANRDPQAAEIVQCLPYLDEQIRRVQPKVIVVVGGTAAHALLQSEIPIGKMRGQVYSYGDAGIPLVVTYHPAYLLRRPSDKRKAWDDLMLAMDVAAGSVT